MDLAIADASSTEDSGCIDGDTCDSDPLLHDLEPDNELNTASGVEFAGSNAEEHVIIGLRTCRFAFEFNDVANVLEFCFGFSKVGSGLATKAAKNIA